MSNSLNAITMQTKMIEQKQKEKELIESSKQYSKMSSIARDNLKNYITDLISELGSVKKQSRIDDILSILSTIQDNSGMTIQSIAGVSIPKKFTLPKQNNSQVMISSQVNKPSDSNHSNSHGANQATEELNSAGQVHNAIDPTFQEMDDKDKIIAMINDEYGITGVVGGGSQETWAKIAAQREDVNVYDDHGHLKDGKSIEEGDILEIHSKKYGCKIQIMVGGDGRITGGDDEIISMTIDAAKVNIHQGLDIMLDKLGSGVQQLIDVHYNPRRAHGNEWFRDNQGHNHNNSETSHQVDSKSPNLNTKKPTSVNQKPNSIEMFERTDDENRHQDTLEDVEMNYDNLLEETDTSAILAYFNDINTPDELENRKDEVMQLYHLDETTLNNLLVSILLIVDS